MTKKNKVPRSIRRYFPNVTECTDSRRPVDIHVTTGDVKAARRMEGDACAMAKAVCRQTKADGAVIGLSYSYIIKGAKAVRYQTSNSVGREITSFDRNEHFEPGEYRLSPISQSQSLGKKQSHSGPSGSRNSEERRVVHKETVNVRSFRAAEKR